MTNCNNDSSGLIPVSSLKLPLKHLNGHKTLGNPYFVEKLTVLNHSGQNLALKHFGFHGIMPRDIFSDFKGRCGLGKS
jgi:hypothetical protein